MNAQNKQLVTATPAPAYAASTRANRNEDSSPELARENKILGGLALVGVVLGLITLGLCWADVGAHPQASQRTSAENIRFMPF
jgi:hypothetical protein